MKLRNVQQRSESELSAMSFDLVVAASGYESRATHVSKLLVRPPGQRRITFGFSDRFKLARRKNDRIFKRLGFQNIDASGSTSDTVKDTIHSALGGVVRDRATVLVDYSSMTKSWYAAILRVFASCNSNVKELDVFFVYSCSKFSRPAHPSPNQYMGPVPGFCNLDLPDRKTALVLGLGYEAERAAGLVEYVEPAETFGFYTDPALDDSFPRTVRKNNAQLLKRLGQSRTFKYPVGDLATTAAILSSLCSGLMKDFRIILAPLGPKPFALLCFLLALTHEELDVWRVSPGEEGEAIDRPPSGDVIVAQVTFKRDAARDDVR